MIKKYVLASLVIFALTLAACTPAANSPVEVNNTPRSEMEMQIQDNEIDPDDQEELPQGEVGQEVQAIDEAIQNLDAAEDFPTFNDDEFSVEE